jgi:hypothetical protein
MQEAWPGDGTYSNYRRSFADVRPRVYQDGDSVSLQFQIGEIQSEMLASDPNFLVLSYTRTMAAFTHFYQEPKRIAIIGLGGGSIPKWCYLYPSFSGAASGAISAGAALGRRLKRRFQPSLPYRRITLNPIGPCAPTDRRKTRRRIARRFM